MNEELHNPSESFLRGIDIHELLPQQEPFVMVDCLVQFDDTGITTETVVKEGNIFVDEGCMTAEGMIENVAQTCAARIGYVGKYILHRDILIGVIGAISNLHVVALPRVGDKITTVVEVKEEVFGITLVSAYVACDGRRLLTTDMKIAVRQE